MYLIGTEHLKEIKCHMRVPAASYTSKTIMIISFSARQP